MGLISLPSLNRVGVYTYWNSVWDKYLNFNLYLYFNLFINFFFFLFFDDLTFNFIVNFLNKKVKVYKKGYLNFFKKGLVSETQVYVYIGKIWFFMYQNWVIIKITFFSPSKEIKKLVNRKLNILKIYKIFLKKKTFNKINNFYSNLNYKYKI